MSGFTLTPTAQADLAEIWENIADDNPIAAERVLDRFAEAFRSLAAMPSMGHFREDLLDKRYKFWNVYSYVIAYRFEVAPIQIIAIIHGARGLDSFFNRDLTP